MNSGSETGLGPAHICAGTGLAAQEMEERHDRIADEPEIGLLKGQLAQVCAGVPAGRRDSET